MTDKLLYKDETYAIRGAIFEVYKEMGCGFLESVFQECMERMLDELDIPYAAQPELTLFFRGEPLNQTFKPDFICHDKIIIELKAVKELTDEHRAQVFNYLKATKNKLGLLVNFGHFPKVQIERIIL